MAVKGSPFSKNPIGSGTQPVGAGLPDFPTAPKPTTKRPTVGAGSATFSTPMGTVKGANYLGSSAEASRSTLAEEKANLDKALRTITSRIATGTGNREELTAAAKQLVEQGKKPDTSRGVWGFVKNSIIKPTFEPVGSVLSQDIPWTGGTSIGDLLGTGSRYIQSAGMYVAEVPGNLAEFTWGGTDWKDLNWTSASEAWRRANDPEWGIFKDPKYKTGNKWIDGVGQFVTDVATDPMTYVTLGASGFAGAAGRRALRDKFAETAMRNLYPELAGKLDDIERFGIWAIPKPIRDAEGLQAGIKFAGQVIPNTDTLGEALAAPFTKARTSIGDAVYKVAPSVLAKTAPKSARAGVEAGLGRGLGIEDDEVVKIAASHSSASYYKGTKVVEYKDSTFEVKGLLDEIDKAGLNTEVRRAAESQAWYDAATPQVRELADRFNAWTNKLRDGVNDVYRKFGIDYGTNVKEIGFVDDYIHHKITDEARRWIFSPKNVTSKKWNPDELLVEELTSAVGAARYRKARLGGEFMGVAIDTPEKATIDGLNKIAFEQTGVKEWFDTSLAGIADSYAYSMASTKAREAWARRMMDFGSDTIRKVTQKAVPDGELVAKLEASHAKLVRSEKIMKAKVFTGVAAAQRGTKRFAERAQQLAKKVLDGNIKQAEMTAKEIEQVRTLLAQVDVELQDVRSAAAQKTAQQRGDFTVVHKELVRFRQRLATALEKGDMTELAVAEELKRIYAVMYPKAKNIPDDVNVLAERILQKQGVPAAREIREVKARLDSLREQLDEMPTTREYDDARQGLIDAQIKLEEDLKEFELLANIRSMATYSQDGMLYGTVDDLVALPDGVAPYKVLETLPDKAMIDNPDYVAVHAYDEQTLIDLRKPADFRGLFGEEYLPDYVRAGMDNAGMDSEVFYAEFVNFKKTGQLDPMFVEMYPEEAQLIQTLDFLNNMPIPDEGLTHGLIEDAFNALDEAFRGVASRYSYEGSDEIARQLIDDVLAQHLMNDPRTGIIAPRGIPTGVYDSGDETFSVLLDTNYAEFVPPRNAPRDYTDDVKYVTESSVVRSIINGDYETASLNASMEAAAAADQLMENELGLMTRQTLEKDARAARGRLAGMSSGAKKRVAKTEKLMEEFRATGKMRITIDGKRVTIDKETARKMLVKADAKYSKAEKRMLAEIARIESRAAGKVEKLLKRQMEYEDRLATLMDQQILLQNWNDTTGELLRNEVDNLNEIMRMRPPKGAAAEQTRQWQRKVKQSIETMNVLPDGERRAYEALTTILHADEAKLAWLSETQIPVSAGVLDLAKQGYIGGPIVDDILDGWEKIAALGVQVPQEVLDVWKPNVEKLRELAKTGMLGKSWDWYMRFFKTYAMMSTGFIVRNVMSATVNNYIAGVTTRNIIRGAKAMIAIEKNGAAWLDDFERGERLLLEEARKVAAASSGGQASELAEPVIGRTWAEAAINNRATKFFRRLNEKAEMAVRMPLAIESLEMGMNFDQALARVNRYHFDYSDLSALDETAKKFVPFWIWSTRNIPLQVANQWSRPGVYATHEKLKKELPVEAGIFVPQWMQDMNALGIGGNWVLTPDLPFNRLSAQASAFANPQKLLGQINPIAKVPLELIADKQFSTDIPFTEKYQEAKGIDAATAWLGDKLGLDFIGKRDKDGKLLISSKASYVPNALIPTLAQGQRLSGGELGGKASYNERQLSSLLNYIGIPARFVGEDQQRSEAINRQFAMKDFAKILEERGLIAPNK